MNQPKLDDEKDNLNPWYLLFIGVILVWSIPIFLPNNLKLNSNWGDLYNSANTLFSGLALCGIILTVILQKNELALQRKELKETRHEFEIQNETLKKQRFENTFFQLLNLHHEIVRNLDYTRYDDKCKEREVFVKFISDLKAHIYKDYFKSVPINPENIGSGTRSIPTDYPLERYEENLIKQYKQLFSKVYENTLGHYFRNLYHIFKLIYTTDLIPDSDKQFYASVVRAQLSSKELAAVFYNSLVEDLGYPKFLFLIKEFDILQNLSDETILDSRHITIFENYLQSVENPFKK